MKYKKVLVTGGAGFLGSIVVEKLIKRGVLKKNILIPRSKNMDLRKWENCVKAVKGRDLVIHLAGDVGGIGYNRENPGSMVFNNLMMGIQLMETARQAKVKKFVTVGTICGYPKFTPVPFKEKDFWNGYPEETNAPYGLAKKMLLVQGQAYRQQYGFNSIYLIPVNLYGPGDNFDPASSHVIPALIRKVDKAIKNKDKYIEVWGDGSASREFLYVDDAAEGIVLAAEKYNKSEPINLGVGSEINIKKLVTLICHLMSFKGKIKWDKSKPNGQPRRVLDISRAKKEFGFEAKQNLIIGLYNTIKKYHEIYGK